MSGRRCERHTRIFERSGRVQPLMLRLKTLNASYARTTRHAIEWSIAFTQRDDVLFRDVWEKFTEAPHSALVEGTERCAAIEPLRFQCRCIEAPFRREKL